MSEHAFATRSYEPGGPAHRRWLRYGCVGLAVVMLGLVLLPPSTWRSPAVDATARGFDVNTMYVDQRGDGTTAGSVDMTASSLSIAASAGSAPLVDLTTGPLSEKMQTNLRIDQAPAGSTALAVNVSSPYSGATESLVFRGAPDYQITQDRSVRGVTTSSAVIGAYQPGELLHLAVTLDRQHKSLTTRLTTAPGSEFGSMLVVDDQNTGYDSHLLTGASIPVKAGRHYVLTTDSQALRGGVQGSSVEWLNATGKRISMVGRWEPIAKAPTGWRERQQVLTAPAGAVSARLEVATAEGASVLFHSVGFRQQSATDGSAGEWVTAGHWRRAEGTRPIEVRAFNPVNLSMTTSATDYPDLFRNLRMAVGVSAAASNQYTAAQLTDFSVEMLHEKWLAVRVDDPVARSLTAALGVLGIIVLAYELLRRRRRWWTAGSSLVARLGPVSGRTAAKAALVGLGVVSLGAICSAFGSLNADIVGARIWAYTAEHDGLSALYFLPNISPAESQQWLGQPWQEAGFPYGPSMAYVYAALGWVYRLFVHQPSLPTSDVPAIDVLSRGLNSLCALVAAGLLVLICRELGFARRKAWDVALVFLFTPPLYLAVNLWGSGQTISMVLLLLAILQLQRRRATTFWLVLLLAAMTRPQNLPGVLVLGLVALRFFDWRTNLRSGSLAVIATFVGLLPFTLTIAPSLPVDVLRNALLMHVGTANDAWTQPMSWGAFSLWPLLTVVAQHVSGVDALLFSANEKLWGLDAFRVGNLLTLAHLLLVAGLAATRGRRLVANGMLGLYVTTATLGLLLLRAETPSYHLLLPFALVFLARRGLKAWEYRFAVAGLGITSAVSMFGMAAYWLGNHPTWSTGLLSQSDVLAMWSSRAMQSAPVVPVMCAVNLVVLGLLTYRCCRPIGERALGRHRADENFAVESRPLAVAASAR